MKRSFSTYRISIAALGAGAFLTAGGGIGTMVRASGIGYVAESISALLFGIGIMFTVVAIAASQSRSFNTVRANAQRAAQSRFEFNHEPFGPNSFGSGSFGQGSFGQGSFGQAHAPRDRVRVPAWHEPLQELSSHRSHR